MYVCVCVNVYYMCKGAYGPEAALDCQELELQVVVR